MFRPNWSRLSKWLIVQWFLCSLLLLIACQVPVIAGHSIPLTKNRQTKPPRDSRQDLQVRRTEVLDGEEKIRYGGAVPKMSAQELRVNDILLTIKDREVSEGLNNSAKFLPSHHFFRVKKQIEQSEVFRFINEMPKGALLHGHNTAMVSSEWFIRNITYREGIMMYSTEANVFRFTFARPEGYDWRYVADMRKRSQNVTEFDAQLEAMINLNTPDPELDYPDIDVVWRKFQNMFETVKDALTYYPVFVDYHRQLLQELWDDRIMYAEIRTGAAKLYDDSGRIYTGIESTQVLQDMVRDFTREHPDFFGLKLIYASNRRKEADDYEDLNKFKELRAHFPDFVIGFDVVGQEKADNPNAQYAEQIKILAKDTKFFFHAGETNWFGTPMDHNIIDALLWNTTRIGHGYALMKHPLIWNTVKQRRIAVEVCPISNQVLKLVLDMRNHPAAIMVSENVPIVISSDDPGFWGAKGLSYDYYYAFMSFYPAYSGLEALKSLVFASIEYSVLTDSEWLRAQRMLQKEWEQFLVRITNMYNEETESIK